MLDPSAVKASVVDLGRSRTWPRDVVLDTNILYLINFDPSTLIGVGGRPPARYQTSTYPPWIDRAVAGGVGLRVASTTLVEFSHVVERAEMEILWRSDPNRPDLDPGTPGQDFSPRYVKFVRSHYLNQLGPIRVGIETRVASLLKTVELLPHAGQAAEAFAASAREWRSSMADISDAVLVATAKRVGIPRIVSDDADLVTSEGITVYTANRSAIEPAREAGRLLA